MEHVLRVHLAAETNNGKGVSSTGYNIKIHTVERPTWTATSDANLIYELAQQPHVKIINFSASGCTYHSMLAEVYRVVRQDLNVLLVAAAGNGLCNNTYNPSAYNYPASYDHVMSVSSVANTYPIGTTDSFGHQFNWRDVHQSSINPQNPERSTHQHNDKVDIVAPGYSIRVIKQGSDASNSSGTSHSAPMVAAAAALVLSVNPNLSADQIEDILKSTADDIYWIPWNQPYLGKLGTGRLNVFRAVKTAQCINEANPVIDLVVRDSNTDVGNEPNNQSSTFWKSENIWVRNQNDGRYNDTHQNPEYSPTNPVYVYVKVTNYGCQTSLGNDKIMLYWSVAGTSQPWPSAWNGMSLYGGPIGTVIIPELEPGQEAVLELQWYPPNPDNFPNQAKVNFSLLARIISDEDPITYTNGSNINNYVKHNNNVAWKNIHLANLNSLSPISLLVPNYKQETQAYSLELIEQNPSNEKKLYEEAEIGIKIDDNLYEAWVEGGEDTEQITSTNHPNSKLIFGNHSKLNNIILSNEQTGIVDISFNFLTRELIDKEFYEYDIIQRDQNTEETVGGFTIYINKQDRNIFVADAEKIENGYSTTLVAESIGEPATYNWYDSEGNLVYSGMELNVSPEIIKTYKLEVISDLDGFKDYKEIEVKGSNLFSLNNVVPNPASSQITVNYNISTASSAYLSITNMTTGDSNSYVLSTTTSQTTINLSNYQQGIYTISLVCNGAVVSSKNLIKN